MIMVIIIPEIKIRININILRIMRGYLVKDLFLKILFSIFMSLVSPQMKPDGLIVLLIHGFTDE